MKEYASKEQITKSLRAFKSRRDDLLHEDVAAFDYHLQRFIDLCRSDLLVQQVIKPLQEKIIPNLDEWWKSIQERGNAVSFPVDQDEEFLLRYKILESICNKTYDLFQFGYSQGIYKRDELTALFRTMIIRPFADELSHRLGEAADLASPEARELQAVPLNRIPTTKEVKIFLSHKSVDKPLVRRYYDALKELGFDPWLDEPNMAAGSNLERELFRGFQESCAAVFFITDNFKDEEYLASEVDYALKQKRAKGKKFSIIILKYPSAASVPDILTTYTYVNVQNDLQGFYELLRALPLELGSARWKVETVTN